MYRIKPEQELNFNVEPFGYARAFEDAEYMEEYISPIELNEDGTTLDRGFQILEGRLDGDLDPDFIADARRVHPLLNECGFGMDRTIFEDSGDDLYKILDYENDVRKNDNDLRVMCKCSQAYRKIFDIFNK